MLGNALRSLYHFSMVAKMGKKRERTGASVAIAVAIACAFLALAALLSFVDIGQAAASSDANAPDRLLSGFAIVGVPVLTAWGISINHRCINTTVRRVLLAITCVMVAWLCVAAVATTCFGVVNPPLMAIAVLSDLGVMLVIETYVDARIFPSIHRYRALFHRLPFDLKILNAGGRVLFKTDIARPIDNTTLWQLARQGSAVKDGPVQPIHSPSLPNVVFKAYGLSAGVGLLTEDATRVTQLQQRLEERQAQLTSQNEILRRNHAMQSLLYRQRREAELGERVERDLASTATQISNILDHRIVGSGPQARAERLQQLNLVKVLVAYSKRKGMLTLAAAESETLTSAQLELVAREAMADLHSIGIECAILVDSSAPISIEAFNTVYDCFYDCILSVLPRANPVIMTYITTLDDGVLEMRAVIECAIGLTDANAVEMIPQVATSTDTWTAVQMSIAHDLEGRLATRGGDFEVVLDEGLVSATVRANPPAPFVDESGEGGPR